MAKHFTITKYLLFGVFVFLMSVIDGIKFPSGNWWQPSARGVPLPIRTSLFKRHADKTVHEKLAPIPVFVVKSSNSMPYYRFSSDFKQEVVPMYLDHSDAEECLQDVSRASSSEERPRIEVLSMAKCYEMAKSSGDYGLPYVFIPSSKTKNWLKEAKKKCTYSKKLRSPNPSHLYQSSNLLETLFTLKKMVLHQSPCLIGYEAAGLTVKRGHKETVKPIFLSFDDLMDKWNEKRKSTPSMPLKPHLSLVNVLEVAVAMEHSQESGTKTALRKLQNIGFVPDMNSLQSVSRMRKQGGSKARQMMSSLSSNMD